MPLAPGSRLGPYEILAPLGAGGMGEVYRARDPRLGRQVAIKLLPEGAADAPALDRFRQEARAASALSHPHICAIHDLGEEAGRPFLVMELLEGVTLERLLGAGPLPVERVVALGSQIAEALQAAHARGILHRDIKPANVFVTERGDAKILDFGVAKLARAAAGDGVTGAAEGLTLPGSSVGTLGYMSPEQALGRPVDARSDLFSLGAVLYEMATGVRAFAGGSPAAVFDAILHGHPQAAAERAPGLPPELATVIARALEKEPAARYPDAASLRADLQRVPLRPLGPAAEPASIAVLPFANMSADPENEYFTDGMAEEIINSLCKIEALQVASRTSSFAFKGRNEDIRQIGRTLGVTSVLEGSVRKAGTRLRITAQLIKVDDGYHLWSQRFDRELEDVFAVQDEIAESIASALRVVLTAREQQAIRRVPTRNLEAYDAYLRGLAFLRATRAIDLPQAAEAFRAAIALDPAFALAWAALAEAHAWEYTWFAADPELRRSADEASLKALALDPEIPETHVARGLAASLHNDLVVAGAEFATAARLDPRSWAAYYHHARICLNKGRLAEAERLFAQAAEVRADDYESPPLRCSCLRGLGRLEERRAAVPQALRRISKELELRPGNVRAVYLGAGLWAALGDRETTLEWGRRARAMAPDDAAVGYNIACAYTEIGLLEEALDLLDRNVTTGWGNRAWLENDPDMDPLRSDPRFQAILERMPAR